MPGHRSRDPAGARVMGNERRPVRELRRRGLLEEPQYTRPADFRGWAVPEVLRSATTAASPGGADAQALHRTIRERPDLIEARGGLTDDERRLLEEFPSVGLSLTVPSDTRVHRSSDREHAP